MNLLNNLLTRKKPSFRFDKKRIYSSVNNFYIEKFFENFHPEKIVMKKKDIFNSWENVDQTFHTNQTYKNFRISINQTYRKQVRLNYTDFFKAHKTNFKKLRSNITIFTQKQRWTS